MPACFDKRAKNRIASPFLANLKGDAIFLERKEILLILVCLIGKVGCLLFRFGLLEQHPF